MNNYLDILEESLKKKKETLNLIFESNEKAKGIFGGSTDNLDEIDTYIEEKEKLTKRLEELDEGFESVYERVSDEIKANKDMHSEQIRRLQKLVREVSADTAKVQAQESRMRADFERFIEKQKGSIGEGRKHSRAAMAYYQNKMGGPVSESPIMDKKN